MCRASSPGHARAPQIAQMGGSDTAPTAWRSTPTSATSRRSAATAGVLLLLVGIFERTEELCDAILEVAEDPVGLEVFSLDECLAGGSDLVLQADAIRPADQAVG